MALNKLVQTLSNLGYYTEKRPLNSVNQKNFCTRFVVTMHGNL